MNRKNISIIVLVITMVIATLFSGCATFSSATEEIAIDSHRTGETPADSFGSDASIENEVDNSNLLSGDNSDANTISIPQDIDSKIFPSAIVEFTLVDVDLHSGVGTNNVSKIDVNFENLKPVSVCLDNSMDARLIISGWDFECAIEYRLANGSLALSPRAMPVEITFLDEVLALAIRELPEWYHFTATKNASGNLELNFDYGEYSGTLEFKIHLLGLPISFGIITDSVR